MVRNVPQIPDRTASILSHGEDPFFALQEGVRSLEMSGAECIVIPCNTAHYWFDRLQQHTSTPMISMVDRVAEAVRARGIDRVGLMATHATIATGIYKTTIEHQGGECITPDLPGQDIMMRSIYDIKAGRLEEGSDGMEAVFHQLISQGSQAVILGCTEIPIGLAKIIHKNPSQCIDATALLAEACVDWHYHQLQ